MEAVQLLSILFFLFYTYGFGTLIGLLVKESDDFFEKNIMRLGLGLPAFAFIGCLLSLLGIPLDSRIFLLLAAVGPVISLIKNRKLGLPSLKLTKSNLIMLGLLLIFSVTLYMYAHGAFSYPWMEDDDSWTHAISARYIAVEKTLYRPAGYGFQYLDPYPPAYTMVMGVMLQTAQSVVWTLKFFTALIISLSILFFYFLAKNLMQDRGKALFATFLLAAMPCYLSHFIWALALMMPMFFMAFYSLEQVANDRKWIIPSGLSVAGILLTQPSHAVKFAVLLSAYIVIRFAYDRKRGIKLAGAGILGLLLSFVWWGPMIAMHGLSGVMEAFGLSHVAEQVGSATRVYTASDYFIATGQNMINNPVGVGIVMMSLLLLSLLAVLLSYNHLKKKEGSWIAISTAWLVIAFLGLSQIPFAFYAFRFWMIFAFAAALVCTFGMWFIMRLGRSAGIPSFILLLLVIAGVLATSFVQKYEVNNAQWGPGARWTTQDDFADFNGYMSLLSLPVNTKVFTFGDEAIIIGVDKSLCPWCKGEQEFKKMGFNQTAASAHAWLKNNGYGLVVMDSKQLERYGVNESNAFVSEMIGSGYYTQVFATGNNFRIYKVA